MSKQESYISFIKDELRKGNVEFTYVFELNRTKSNLARSTFSKYWKLANEEYKEEFAAIEKAKIEQRTETEKESVKRDILSKQESLELLSKIAKDETEESRVKIQAVNQMSKMEGWEAPKQVETKDTTIHVINK